MFVDTDDVAAVLSHAMEGDTGRQLGGTGAARNGDGGRLDADFVPKDSVNERL